MSVRKTSYVAEWESGRQQEMETLVSQGKIPHEVELEKHPEKSLEGRMCKTVMCSSACLSDYVSAGLMGKVAGSIDVGFVLSILARANQFLRIIGHQACKVNVCRLLQELHSRVLMTGPIVLTRCFHKRLQV